MSKNIAFYFPNRNTNNIDCSDIFSGNPGIGGSYHVLLALACSLTLKNNDINIIVYTDKKGIFPSILKTKQVSDLSDLIQKTKEDNIHILTLILGVFGHNALDSFRVNEHLKIIIWATNFLGKDVNYCAKNQQISRIVCVGFEQLDLYRDHLVFKKMTAIYNGIDINNIKKQSEPMTPFSQRPSHVTYIGSMVKQKGFYLLAKAWPQILKECPDAVLNVIGSGKMDDKNTRLGKYGIAEVTYENAFMPYITDIEGRVLPSVKLWGLLSMKEKNEILKSTRVGVPNPSGRTETFGYTAIEMQSFGALVTTIHCPAYLETVCPSAGILYRKGKKQDKILAESVLSLLNRNENQYDEVMRFLEVNFSMNKVTGEWYQLFMDMMENKENPIMPIKANEKYRLKHWKEANRKFKNFIPFGYKIIPSLWYVDDILWKLKGLFKRDKLIKYIYRRYILKRKIEQYL
jgi:glycosyltransferase involved in cell wall biosynthesis